MSEKEVVGTRAERMAAKLRENLKRRKQQAREMDSPTEGRNAPPARPARDHPD